MTNKFLFAAIVAIMPLPSSAQTASPVAPQRFSSVVIKPSHAKNWGTSVRDGTLQMNDLLLNSIIANAYGVREDLISGLPGWADSTRFDIVASVNEPEVEGFSHMSREDRSAMIAALLADRFGLKVHLQSKLLPLYQLVPGKDGPKVREHIAQSPTPEPSLSPDEVYAGAGEFAATDARVASLASFLSNTIGSTVIDQTGLRARYDLRLSWAPNGGGGDPAESVPPSLSAALQQQLGLKLLRARGPVETLVVDHVSHPSQH